jgi:hypothetical protein
MDEWVGVHGGGSALIDGLCCVGCGYPGVLGIECFAGEMRVDGYRSRHG